MEEKKPIETEEQLQPTPAAEEKAAVEEVAVTEEPVVNAEAETTAVEEVAVEAVQEEPEAPATTDDETTEVPEPLSDGSEDTSTAATAEADDAAPRKAPANKEEVIERLREIAATGGQIRRPELEQIKQAYYHFQAQEAAAAREAFLQAGGNAEDFQPAPDPLEAEFKAEMDRIKELRAADAASQEAEKKENLKRKLDIIEKIKVYAESPESADKNYEDFKRLQTEWREIRQVPAENATELWKNYQLYVEHFYDQLHLNHEARMYDFRKNLEEKERLCEAAEKLAEVEDPISAFHQLQNLHAQWRETGPVEREKREEIWARFKAASTAVNKRHQAHFDALKEQEEENLRRKTELCEKVEALELEGINTAKEWDRLQKEVLEMQAQWKTIGFTPRKMNAKIFERFRAGCDRFFQRKAEFYKQNREQQAANLEKKTALVEQAEALKESTEWNSTANKLIALQKEWKTIGPVAHRVSESIWRRFNDACNYFFERKNEATGDQRREQEANLEKKNDIIARLEALLTETVEDAQQAVRDLQDEWNATGHVPFRKKDKLYARYREVLDRIYNELHISARRRNVENFRRSVAEKAGNALTRERQRLQTILETKMDEIKTYETNLSFFTVKSKEANSFIDDVKRKIERLKDDVEAVKEKIRAVRDQEKAEAEGNKEKEEKEETPAE